MVFVTKFQEVRKGTENSVWSRYVIQHRGIAISYYIQQQ